MATLTCLCAVEKKNIFDFAFHIGHAQNRKLHSQSHKLNLNAKCKLTLKLTVSNVVTCVNAL